MTTITINQMCDISGGSAKDVVDYACIGIQAGNIIYGIGIAAHWWNPIGWVSTAGALLSIACDVYYLATVI